MTKQILILLMLYFLILPSNAHAVTGGAELSNSGQDHRPLNETKIKIKAIVYCPNEIYNFADRPLIQGCEIKKCSGWVISPKCSVSEISFQDFARIKTGHDNAVVVWYDLRTKALYVTWDD